MNSYTLWSHWLQSPRLPAFHSQCWGKQAMPLSEYHANHQSRQPILLDTNRCVGLAFLCFYLSQPVMSLTGHSTAHWATLSYSSITLSSSCERVSFKWLKQLAECYLRTHQQDCCNETILRALISYEKQSKKTHLLHRVPVSQSVRSWCYT